MTDEYNMTLNYNSNLMRRALELTQGMPPEMNITPTFEFGSQGMVDGL